MWTFHVIELSVFALFVIAVWHSSQISLSKVSTLLGAVAFGLLIELYFVTFAQGYAYGDFLVDPPVGGHSVPLWVGVGWGTIIYAAMTTSDRMGLLSWVRPAVDALLAVSVDLALDPVADHVGWWEWSRDAQFFGIPCDNFIGWLMIVGFYSMTVRWLLHLLEHSKRLWVLLAPVLAIVCSCILVVICQFGLEALYPIVGEPLVFAAASCTLFGLVAARWGSDPASSAPTGWFPSLVVLYMHGLMLLMLIVTDLAEHSPELLVVMPLAAITSVLGFHHRAASIS